MAYLGEDTLLPTSYFFEIELLERNSPEFKTFIRELQSTFTDMAERINLKDIGTYYTQETINGQTFFPDRTNRKIEPRPVYRTVVNFGALPHTGTTNVAHGITFPVPNSYTFTRIYGAATDPATPEYIPLPYASPIAANNISVSVGPVNVTITTGSDRSAFTTSYVILEYIKS